MVDICFYCNCLTCICKLLQPDWTSGNKYIDKFIKEAQLKVNVNLDEIIIEWIPFNGLRNIKYLAHGGFSTIYKAIWLDGYIISSDKRHRDPLNYEDHKIAKEKDVKSPLNKNEKKGVHVALKSLKNSSNISDDFINELKNHLQYICKGLRPEIVKSTLPVYASLMKRCWDSNPNKRPTAEELHQITAFWCDYFPKCYENKRNKIPSNEQITKNHPLSCYTSRKIDYSAKINEILSQEELSNKIVIDEEKEIINDITSLSKNLENFRIPDLKKILKEENFRIPDLKKILKE
ncbi:uncharacterized protein OCT59_027376 [Rhizophagus irregularis]|uniref:uncharacterized protein n=1 Tax=Rhizophagus irregularis TaxID=588596 RepID=UPI00331845E3|nr:hypothetical protein OCT59_027376 [Rhizophagus irregularis]